MCVTTIQAVTVLCLVCFITPVASGCDIGWFGNSCNYQCHCSNNDCDDSGECTAGSKCTSEWFGPACQYQDLFSFAVTSTITTIGLSTLKDRDDNTCLKGNIEDVTIYLNSSYTITWIRVTVNSNDFKHNITMMLNDAQGSTFTCNNKYLIDERTVDLFCDAQILTAQLTLRGTDVGYMCSLSISGGRNVALKQRAMQTSTFSNYYVADKAVDGNRNTNLEVGNSCSHTDDGSPNWNVTLSNFQLVNRYVLFNRYNIQQRLRIANLLSYNASNSLVLNYTLPNANQIVYVVTDVPKNVSYVRIYARYEDVNNFVLTLCEVEIYGDSVCPTNYFGLECNSLCNCESKTESCFVATGGCPSGCAAGFYGGGCQKPCSQGRWGVDCINQCGIHCKNKTCDRIQGKCDLGCEDGYKSDTCGYECASFTWGKDCLHKCSPQCFNKSCNITNGVCLSGCTDGYTGDTCTEECPKYTWGSKCSNNCSSHCADKTCDQSNGTCDNGCEAGYSGHTCDQISPNLTWCGKCLKRCSDHCLNKTCNFVNGICDHGCDFDFNNTQCLDATSALDYTAVYNNGLASGIGIGIGVTIAAEVIICIALYIWLKRRQKPLPKPLDTIDRQNDLDPIQSRNTTVRPYENVEHLPSPDTTDRHYDHVDPIQPNEHPYNTVD